ncbi:hypothetical protein AALP_AA4G183600 [Arabis alpina]|uniref:Uncharacterized protein n=1 Tax=Arabis alpina TaxID=50452 RepID=A0A087H426_ARAAL|nr:hypothetical protein AALP_AA4G183600 [Arabis alpina]
MEALLLYLRPSDTAVYGVPSSGLTRRKVLEKYQEYGDSVIGTQGKGRRNVRDIMKSLLNVFHSEMEIACGSDEQTLLSGSARLLGRCWKKA